jgi:PTH1 family peptidyl-tRNA hydrolase
MKLIVGLGNPDTKYAKTRHNAGFMALDAFVEKQEINAVWKDNNLAHAKTLSFTLNSEQIILVKPQTYMNNSGQAIASLLGQYKITQEDMILIYDDYDLDLGLVKVRNSGSAGGHNGVKSVISVLKTENFVRIRLGIKNTNENNVSDTTIPLEEYVLVPFLQLEQDEVKKMLEETVDYLKKLVEMGYTEFISKHHK